MTTNIGYSKQSTCTSKYITEEPREVVSHAGICVGSTGNGSIYHDAFIVGLMAKIKKKLTAAQKAARKKAKQERQKKYQTVFMNGKQVRIKRPQLIDGIPLDEFIDQNADAIWLHQNEMWEKIDESKF